MTYTINDEKDLDNYGAEKILKYLNTADRQLHGRAMIKTSLRVLITVLRKSAGQRRTDHPKTNTFSQQIWLILEKHPLREFKAQARLDHYVIQFSLSLSLSSVLLHSFSFLVLMYLIYKIKSSRRKENGKQRCIRSNKWIKRYVRQIMLKKANKKSFAYFDEVFVHVLKFSSKNSQ